METIRLKSSVGMIEKLKDFFQKEGVNGIITTSQGILTRFGDEFYLQPDEVLLAMFGDVVVHKPTLMQLEDELEEAVAFQDSESIEKIQGRIKLLRTNSKALNW